jgi:hypothetical protein
VIGSTSSNAAQPAANGNTATTGIDTRYRRSTIPTVAALYFFHLILAERFPNIIQTTSLVPLTQGI